MGKSTYSINEMNSNKFVVEDGLPLAREAGKFRTVLPQILASTAKNLLLLDLGLAVAFPTIVIPVLTGLKNRDENETLTFTPVQASWFGSVAYICQPIGSILSGIVLEPLGRKRSMILVNIPHIIGWFMLHFASTLEEIYFAAVLLGLGVGFMEAPIVTYVGEICQPSIRGILTSCAGVAVQLGFTLVYFIGTVATWRTTAAICASVPLITMIAICFVPETPLWLLSRNRTDEALKSLQWLRGWVSPTAVDKEFKEMQRYNENSSKCILCQKSKVPVKCNHPPPSEFQKFKELLRKRTMKPFILVMVYFGFCQFSGLPAMRPFLVQIFQAYNLPIDASWATVIVGFLSLIANIVCMTLIKFVGKRKLSLFSMVLTSLSCICLSFYAFNILPRGWTSFDKHTVTEFQANLSDDGLNYIPMILFFVLAFATAVGIAPVPWILLSEVFPFKSRSMASGITAALNYILTFITTKMYFNLETSLSLSGVILLYGIIGAFGVLFIYFYLPETEKRTLEEIEIYFSDNKRKLTDIKIKRDTTTLPAHHQMTISTIQNGIQNDAFSES
uniref:Putative transmembrane transport n=1 Tax=Corethrella appendiculata TaxID=1370023 RepID=U5EU35_9DIPT